MNADIERLKAVNKEYRLLANVCALLGWDQETYMPSAGIEARSEQLALMGGIGHATIASPEVGRLLEDLGCADDRPGGDPSLPEDERLFLRAFRRTWAQQVKLPESFVMDQARAISRAQDAWATARERSDFASFRPHLEAMVDYARREAAYLDGKRPAYDSLLDKYEPGASMASIDPVFAELRTGLLSLLDRIRSRPQVDDSCLRRPCPASKQEAFSRRIMATMGFDADRGRLDVSAHPFTTTIGFRDVRITTAYREDFLASSISSTVHESGHALYELGLPEEWKLTERGEAASTAVHESQSRFWENILGRSRGFWAGQLPLLKEDLSPVLDGVGLEEFWRAYNRVEPSLIRVDADEVTYSLHIILRYRLERALMDGSLEAAGVPEAWNRGMEELLGIRPPDDASGCLQDIHWSMGSFGYFPSYALGNLYSAQFAARMAQDLGDLDGIAASGSFAPILGWLREKVHSAGASLLPGELLLRATGQSLSPRPFLDYLEKRYAEVYGF